MSAANIQKLCEATREQLISSITALETFLNENALPELLNGQQDKESILFYKGFYLSFGTYLSFLKYPMRS